MSDRQKRDAAFSHTYHKLFSRRMRCLISGQCDYGERCRPRSRVASFNWLSSFLSLFVVLFSDICFAATRYVWTNSPNPGSGYISWNTAAHTIQDAIDAAASNEVVLVTNGVFEAGARMTPGASLSNRVVITNNIRVRSVNGPAVTVIKGRGPQEVDAVRCVFITSGYLDGFTLTNGVTQGYEGGGVNGALASACVLTNCTLTGNSAGNGGGACSVTLNNCTLTGNSATYGGGACYSTLNNCVLTDNSVDYFGGGAYSCSLNNCRLSDNSASYGGGTSGSILSNCIVSDNRAISDAYGDADGGGAHESALVNCTISSNSAISGGGVYSCALSNCVVSDNNTVANPYGFVGSGGGACESTLRNCTVNGNSANAGGGAIGSTLDNCAVRGNKAFGGGGGAYSCTLNNCTVSGNSDASGVGGGVFRCGVTNSIVYYNTARQAPNYSGGSFGYSCTTPDPGGTGNITIEPKLASAAYLSSNSPCIGKGGSAFCSGVDINGDLWLNPPCMGCDQVVPGSVTGVLSVAILAQATGAVVNVPIRFSAEIQGRTYRSAWSFADGTTTTNALAVSHSWNAPGDYPVVLTAWNDTYPGGLSTTTTVHIANQYICYVSQYGSSPASPYSSWATAATSIQDAIDVCILGGQVMVSNGNYAVGGKVDDVTYQSSRVVATNAISIQSVNGPAWTSIDGQGAVRCAFLANSPRISGFTLSNGVATFGAGIYALEATFTNCIFSGNAAGIYGGGVYGGTLHNCIIRGNTAANGGGAYSSELDNCVLSSNSVWGNIVTGGTGGGASQSTLTNCTLWGNSAEYGGGASGSTLNNCIVSNNFGDSTFGYYDKFGGGVSGCTLNYCTLIGNSATYGGGASASTLNNCVIQGNSAVTTFLDGGSAGGGVDSCMLNNCTINNNSASKEGGGCFKSTLNNCAINSNFAGYRGGGAYEGALINCTVIGNVAKYESGGGVYHSAVTNSIVFYNTAPTDPNFSGGSFGYSCTTPGPGGVGNISTDPMLTSAAYLSSNSPCIGKGSYAYCSGVDINGDLWLNPPCMGCDQIVVGAVTGGLSVTIQTQITNAAAGFAIDLAGRIEGRPHRSVWNFGDGTTTTNCPYISHAWNAPGDYEVTLTAWNSSNPGGVTATKTVHISSRRISYVKQDSSNPISPYSSWATAAADIQSAINVCTLPGDMVLVTNGAYNTGGRISPTGTLSNRCVATNTIIVQSVNGPTVTTIVGPTPGSGGMRCAFLANGAILSGFTLSNGVTSGSGFMTDPGLCGGGAYALGGRLTNCVFTGNWAALCGGGVYGGVLNNCVISNNATPCDSYFNDDGGGAYQATLNNCVIVDNLAYEGGGASFCVLNNCILSQNLAYEGGGTFHSSMFGCSVAGNMAVQGGGASDSDLYACIVSNNAAENGGGACGQNYPDEDNSDVATLENCLVVDNTASIHSGGAYQCDVINSTITRNSAQSAGGVSSCRVYNSIVYYNQAADHANYSGSMDAYNCTTPQYSWGTGNITNPPAFLDEVSGNCRLSASSPCINNGNLTFVRATTDLDGNPRVQGGSVDMGAYEAAAAVSTYYRDADGDGYGDPNVTITATSPPTGFVANNLDWNDNKASVYPNAPEIPDGLDNNGDGQIDEGARDGKTCFSLDQSIRCVGAGWSRTFVMDLTNFRDLGVQDGYQSYTVDYLLYYNIWTGIYLYGYDSGKFDAVTWLMNLDL